MHGPGNIKFSAFVGLPYNFFLSLLLFTGARRGAVCWGTQPEGRGFDSRLCNWNFSFLPHYCPGVDSASNWNEQQEYFLVVKTAGALGWHLYHLHVPIVLNCGSLKLLEPSGPVQACNGIALPLYLFMTQRHYCCKHSIIVTHFWQSYWLWLL
jgi:hypothetical protein